MDWKFFSFQHREKMQQDKPKLQFLKWPLDRKIIWVCRSLVLEIQLFIFYLGLNLSIISGGVSAPHTTHLQDFGGVSRRQDGNSSAAHSWMIVQWVIIYLQ